MNVLELRAEIQALLSEEIGSYTLTGNVTTPAIAVLDSGDTLSDRTVTGLEVIIRRMPVKDVGQPMFDCVRAAKEWQVFLVQWQGNHTLQAAIDKLRQKFPNMRAVPVGIEKGTGIREQVSVKIPDDVEASNWL